MTAALAMGDLEWTRPLVLLGFLSVPLYWYLRWRVERHDRVPFAPLQLVSLAGASGWRQRLKRVLLPLEAVLLAAVVCALAGPQRKSEIELIDDAGIDVALVLDISLSMLAEDFEPSRLAALRHIAGQFLTRRSADRVALVIFAKDAYVQSPLTSDDAVVLRLLEGVTTDAVDQFLSGGTAIGDALLVAADQLSRARIEGRDQSVILITDGESNLGIAPEIAARYLHELEISFFAIGVGGPEPIEVFREGRSIGDGLFTVLDEEALVSFVAAGGGHYFRAADNDALEAIFGELSRLQSLPLESRVIERRRSVVPVLALLALGLFSGYVGLSAGLLRRPLR